MDDKTEFYIESFFNWIDGALNTAEKLLHDEDAEFTKEASLMICLSVLDTMAFSRYAKPLSIDPDKREYSYKEIDDLLFSIKVSQPQIIKFIKKFTKNTNPPFFNRVKRAIYISTRDGSELFIPAISDDQLFLLARNSLVHTGRNIGAGWFDTNNCLFQCISTDATDELGRKTKSRIDGLSPKTTIRMLRIVAQQYKAYCTKNSRDPRTKINPVAFLFE